MKVRFHAALPMALAFMLVASAAQLSAQTVPTPENTSIANTVTVNYKDVNGNTYAAVTGTVTVQVAYKDGMQVSGPASASPDAGAAGNGSELSYVFTNSGNGTDNVIVSHALGASVAVAGYKIGATTYNTLAELNAELALPGRALAQGGSITVVVLYNNTLTPGVSSTLTTTGRMTRRGGSAASASRATTITPAISGAVTVEAPGAEQLVPTGPATTTYTRTFRVRNGGNVARVFDLVATAGAHVTITLINGVAPAGATVSLAATDGTAGSGGDETDVTVTFTLSTAANQLQATSIVLRATSQGAGSVQHEATYSITVIKPVLQVVKTAWRENGTTAIDPANADPAISRVAPGETFIYRLTISNIGEADAEGVQLSDPLSTQLLYSGFSATPAAGWTWTLPTVGTAGGTVQGDYTPALAKNGSLVVNILVTVR